MKDPFANMAKIINLGAMSNGQEPAAEGVAHEINKKNLKFDPFGNLLK